MNGVTATPADWPTCEGNRLADTERMVEPAALLRHYARAFPRLASPDAWLDSAPDTDISVLAALRQAGASEEALRLIAANFNGNSLAGMSQLGLARTFAIFASQPGPVATIAGGSQRLPEAMAASLRGDVRTGQTVRGLREEADGVTLHLAKSTLRAAHAICTIPFAALRHIPVETTLAPAAARMIAELPYTRASFAYIAASEPFWKTDGLPATLWSDDPLIGRVFVLGSAPPMLKLWTTGAGADLPRTPATRRGQAHDCLAHRGRMRPAAQGKLSVLRIYSWQHNPGARGIYHHIGNRHGADLAATTRHRGSRLHFAGEHLGRAASGMEAAFESAEAAAEAVLARA